MRCERCGADHLEVGVSAKEIPEEWCRGALVSEVGRWRLMHKTASDKLDDALLQIGELKAEVESKDFLYNDAKNARDKHWNSLQESNRLYNELVMLVVPMHQWIATGARYSDGHDDCETCDWLEKNTKFGEKQRTEKRNDLGLDFATYEAAKKEQAEGKRIPLDQVIEGLDKRICVPGKCCKHQNAVDGPCCLHSNAAGGNVKAGSCVEPVPPVAE